jgi:hypothetical protein
MNPKNVLDVGWVVDVDETGGGGWPTCQRAGCSIWIRAPGALASMKQFTVTTMYYKRKERTIQFVVIT